jgi:hypothetical protein
VRVGSTKGPARPFHVVDRVRFVSVASAWQNDPSPPMCQYLTDRFRSHTAMHGE